MTTKTTKRSEPSLYEMLDKMQFIIANGAESHVECNEPFYEALREYNEEYEMKEPIGYNASNYNLGHQKEFDAMAKKHPKKTLEEVWDDLSTELKEEILDAIRDSDYPDVYQTFIVDDSTAKILKKYGQIVWYNDDMELYFWGVTHYGTAWSHIMGQIYPV